MNIKKFVIWVLPFILLVLFGGLEVAGVFTRAEHAVYDAWLHLKPEVEQREEILFLDVDDLSIARVGVWPWSRDIMARGLLALKEFDSGPVVFDIEYVDASPLAVDGQVLRDQLPSAFSREFGRSDRQRREPPSGDRCRADPAAGRPGVFRGRPGSGQRLAIATACARPGRRSQQ
jgi:adenylate cyclase